MSLERVGGAEALLRAEMADLSHPALRGSHTMVAADGKAFCQREDIDIRETEEVDGRDL